MEFDPYNDKSWIEDPLFKELKKIDGKEHMIERLRIL